MAVISFLYFFHTKKNMICKRLHIQVNIHVVTIFIEISIIYNT